jgi:hypothetical protein
MVDVLPDPIDREKPVRSCGIHDPLAMDPREPLVHREEAG